MAPEPFAYRVSCGWIRDLASQPTPGHAWPCIRWDEALLADQARFLDAQAELGMQYNLAWGLFIDRAWPVPLENVIDARREEMLRAFVEAAHRRGIRILAGTGVYSWGFDEVIAKVPGVSAGGKQVMCAFSGEAWDWQRRVLDFQMDPRWGLDGLSMQSADQGRCECEKCFRLTPAEHHARLLTRCAEHVRANRPDWTIGQACWGLRVDEPAEFEHVRRISQAVDYMIEVNELSAAGERDRRSMIGRLGCAFGSVGGVFVEPPQHWDRLRWFVPCGLASARALRCLHADGGRACEYYYRPFANPVEEVSWRTGARILSAPQTEPEQALAEAAAKVYGATGQALAELCDWLARGEQAHFSRSSYRVGQGPISLEPLWWAQDPAAEGPPVYLSERMDREARAGYAADLAELRGALEGMALPNDRARADTLACIDAAMAEVARLG